MIQDCEIPDCTEIPHVVIRDAGGESLRVCTDHWQEVLLTSDGRIRGVQLLELPRCCRPACRHDAVTRVIDPDGARVPVCQQHLDDLSWVSLPGPLLPHEPGWSHG